MLRHVLSMSGLALLTGWLCGWQDSGLKLRDDAHTKCWSLLAGLLFAALVVERFIEVLVGVSREQTTQPLKRAAAVAARAVKVAASIPGGALNQDGGPERLKELEQASEVSSAELAREQGVTRRCAVYTGYVLGLIVSACGVRTLGEMYVALPEEKAAGGFPAVFNGADILLTAGLIAGGSQGLHLMLKTFGGLFESARKNTEPGNPIP
jgi:hypothetical protein